MGYGVCGQEGSGSFHLRQQSSQVKSSLMGIPLARALSFGMKVLSCLIGARIDQERANNTVMAVE